MLQTKLYAYLIQVPREDLDLCQFLQLSGEGRKALGKGDSELAGRLLSQALSLWRGPALADVDAGEVLAAHATRLEEDRVQRVEARLEAHLQLGRHAELISELKALTSAHPLHKGYHGKLMVALHRSDRRGEALDVYHNLRRGLVEELGLEPGREHHLLQRALLSSDPSIDLTHRATLVTTRTGCPTPPGPSMTPIPCAPRRELSGSAYRRRVEATKLGPDNQRGSPQCTSRSSNPPQS